MSQLEDIAKQDNWRCWVCDEPVDRTASANDPRGPSVDSRTTAKLKKGATDYAGGERLAHKRCNTRKGAVTPVIPWPSTIMLVEPAPLIAVAERLDRKGGREVVVRCADRKSADQTAAWLVDRFSRLAPGMPVEASVEPGGGQFLVALTTARRR